jgi:hypothetical protein
MVGGERMRYINIVHLSDLHLKSDGLDSRNQLRILENLTEDIAQLSRTNLKPDLVVFTGDLANAGDKESYGECRRILYKLLSECCLPPENLVIAPGNHDARQFVAERDGAYLSEIREGSNSPDGANSLMFDNGFVAHLDEKFSDFRRFASSFSPKTLYEDAYLSCFLFDALGLAVISLNTALLSAAGSKKLAPDDRKLAFPDLALETAFGKVPGGYTKIVIGHHPLSMLNENSSASMKTLLCKRAAAYLFGHMHRASPENVQSASGECKFLQSGALYMGKNRWNGYHVVSLIPGTDDVRVTTRRWHEQRLAFGVSTELSDDGIIYLPPSGKSVWDQVVERPNYQKLESWRKDELLPSLRTECSQSLTSQPLGEVYVDQEFERDVYVDTISGREVKAEPETVTYDSIRESSRNLIIAAQSEAGKTALVRHWAEDIASTSAFTPGWTVPVILNYNQLRSYFGGIENAVIRRMQGLPEGVRGKALLASGLVTIFIDDMRLEDTKEKSALCEFMDAYPDCRYVLLTSSQFIQGPGITPRISDRVHFETVRIKKLNRSQLLSLIEKHGTAEPQKADRLLDRLLIEANSLSVPLTPVTSTFLIRIFTERSAKPVINRGSLLERYVEINLEKFAPDEILSDTFDFHNKTDLLSDIAEKMCRSEEYSWTEKATIDSIQEYLDRYDLNYSPVALMKYLVGARILELTDGHVGFRLRAFLEYFAARRMVDDPKFKAWVLDEIRYLQFEGEIACYAALTRRDGDWVTELVDRFEKNSEQVWAKTPSEVRDGSILENLVLPQGSATEEEVFALERRILAEELGEEGRRELLSSSSSGPENGKLVNRPDIRGPGEEWSAQLNMLSSMLRHMELIPKDQKSSVLDKVIKNWISVLSMSIGLAPALAQQKRITFNGISYEIHFPDGMSIGEITRRMLLSMPLGIFRMIHQMMGTDKLEIPLSKGLSDKDSDLSGRERLMRVGLLSLLGNDGVADQLESVAKSLEGKPYLAEVLLRQLYELAVRYRLPDSEISKVRTVAADLATRLEAIPSARRDKRRAEIIQNLVKSRLIVGMDPKTEIDVKKLKSNEADSSGPR